MRVTLLASTLIAVVAVPTSAQTVLFDFNNAPLHSPLPVTVTAGGITAYLTATGPGFSIQDNSAPVVPVGFTGRFVYPSSVYPADLLVSFDRTITDFSILYSPQELGCDDSATMRVTANWNGAFVGTHTKTASNPGTWPVDTLSCSFPQGFNSVVIHYDSHPPTCTDWGPIFLADDMRVTPMTPLGSPFCSGDGSGGACPCGNSGLAGHGCNNSQSTGGADLSASGSTSPDAVVLSVSGEVGTSLTIFFQGDASVSPVAFGDGLRCVGGVMRRLYIKGAPNGTAFAPGLGDPSITTLSANLGDTITAGSNRYYQTYYRDPDSTFCPSPAGSTFNSSNSVAISW